jgi:hypothetical protein
VYGQAFALLGREIHATIADYMHCSLFPVRDRLTVVILQCQGGYIHLLRLSDSLRLANMQTRSWRPLETEPYLVLQAAILQ